MQQVTKLALIKFESSRLSAFQLKDMRIAGNEVTTSSILPSDHFGLFTVIEHIEKP